MRHSRLFGIAAGAVAALLASNCAAGPLTASYSYNSAGRLVAVDYGPNGTATYAYDAAGNLLQASSPAPILQVGELFGDQLTLFWQAGAGQFVLEYAPALLPGLQWQQVNATVTQVRDRYTATVALGQGGFYRLRKL